MRTESYSHKQTVYKIKLPWSVKLRHDHVTETQGNPGYRQDNPGADLVV